jgi:hypothetical protein
MISLTQIKLVSIGIAVVAAGAWGFATGVAWNADDLAECEGTIETIKGVQYELEQKAEHQRLVSERVVKDTSDSWAAVLAADRTSRPVRVRYENCRATGGMPGLSAAATGNAGLQASSGESWITETTCEQIANDSILDREWIENAKTFVTKQHEASK